MHVSFRSLRNVVSAHFSCPMQRRFRAQVLRTPRQIPAYMYTVTLFPRLSRDFTKFFESKKGSDVLILAGNPAKGFNVHSAVLRARSPYFDTLLSRQATKTNSNVNQRNQIEINEPSIPSAAFTILLKYIYAGVIDWSQVGNLALELLVAADTLELDEFLDQLQDYLIKNTSPWLKRNAVDVLHTIFDMDTCDKLRKHFLNIIGVDPKPLFDSAAFVSLKADILESLLERDILNMEEVEIWDGLVKWGKANAKKKLTDKNISEWDNGDFAAFKNTMQPFLQYIRFLDISGVDYWSKVKPYKVLPKEVKNELTHVHIDPSYVPKISTLPSRIGNIGSTIINSYQAVLVERWINGGNDTEYVAKTKITRKWTLLFRASRDDYQSSAFHKRCDNKGVTVTVVKPHGVEEVFGGYNANNWTSNGNYGQNSSCFLFNFHGGRQGRVVRHVSSSRGYSYNGYYSTYNHSQYGPSFVDWTIPDNCRKTAFTPVQSSYSGNVMNSPKAITIADYEVFHIA